MSVTIRANSRLSTNLDNNSAADATTMAQNGERNLITAADRAERRARRAARLAQEKQELEVGSESSSAPSSTVSIGGRTSLILDTSANKSEAITVNLSKNDDSSKVTVNSVTNQVNGRRESEEDPFSPGPVADPKPAVNVLSNALTNMMADEKKTEQKPKSFSPPAASTPSTRPPSTGGVRGRISSWGNQQTTTPPAKQLPKYGSAAGPSQFSFGTDYTKKASPGGTTNGLRSTGLRSTSTGSPFTPAFNKYTPTVSRDPPPRRPHSTNFTGGSGGGRWQGIQKDEPAAPDLGGASATDRMAHFRKAMEEEKAQKAREEERERKKKETLEKRKLEEEKRKVAEEQKRQEEEAERKREEEKAALEAKAEEEEQNSIPDSEKVKRMAPCKKKKEKKPARRTMSISNIVLDWVQEMVKDYPVEIKNFSGSWNNGMAFCALIHRFNPDEFDFSELSPENKRHNFDLAFNTGKKVKDIPILLDTEDMVRMARPEPRSVQTYIQWIWSVYGPTSGYGPTPQEVQNATIA